MQNHSLFAVAFLIIALAAYIRTPGQIIKDRKQQGPDRGIASVGKSQGTDSRRQALISELKKNTVQFQINTAAKSYGAADIKSTTVMSKRYLVELRGHALVQGSEQMGLKKIGHRSLVKGTAPFNSDEKIVYDESRRDYFSFRPRIFTKLNAGEDLDKFLNDYQLDLEEVDRKTGLVTINTEKLGDLKAYAKLFEKMRNDHRTQFVKSGIKEKVYVQK